jgi:hypothetical protein
MGSPSFHLFSAANACFNEAEKAGVDVGVEKGSADEFCKELGDEHSDEGWECLTETLKDADCSTDTGLNEWLNEADDCPK